MSKFHSVVQRKRRDTYLSWCLSYRLLSAQCTWRRYAVCLFRHSRYKREMYSTAPVRYYSSSSAQLLRRRYSCFAAVPGDWDEMQSAKNNTKEPVSNRFHFQYRTLVMQYVFLLCKLAYRRVLQPPSHYLCINISDCRRSDKAVWSVVVISCWVRPCLQ